MDLKVNKKLVVFVKPGLDHFIEDIITLLSGEYEVKKVIVFNMKQIDTEIEWADICWFEWCDELVVYGSKNKRAMEKKMFCRLHSYEVFTAFPSLANWDAIDQIICVSDTIKTLLLSKFNIEPLKVQVIQNGIDLNKWTYKERDNGFNIAYMGYINYKKGPQLLLHTFKAIYDVDPRYKLYIAGAFQDERYVLYFNQMIEALDLKQNIFFEGWKEDIDIWLEDKEYILCTSVLESQNMGIMQAMAKGIKPIIHNFVGAKEIYPSYLIWDTIDQAVKLITEKGYHSTAYRSFIEEGYSLTKEMDLIETMLYTDFEKNNSIISINSMFDVMNLLDDFSSSITEIINTFDLSNLKIIAGKKERISEQYCLIEYLIENSLGYKLTIIGIILCEKTNELTYPRYIMESAVLEDIENLTKKVIDMIPIKLSGQAMNGFILDERMIEDVNKNRLAYSWERAIPSTEFMPINGYVNIMIRYKFAAEFIKPNHIILEAASGFGYGAAFFSKLCDRVEAIDISEDNILFAKKAYPLGNIHWNKGDVTLLPYDADAFDVYVSFETLEHLELERVSAYFSEAYRVLKSGGQFIISTPNSETRKNIKNPFHIKEYCFTEFKDLLNKYFEKVNYFSQNKNIILEGVSKQSTNMIAICKK